MLIRYLFKLSNHGVRQNMLVLISVSWLPLLFISMIEGSLLSNVDIPFLKDVVPYVRCLVVIPLLILIEAVIAPMLANVIDYLASSKIVIEQELDELARYKDSMYKQMDSVWSNAILLLLALFVSSITRMDYQQMLELQQQSSWAFYLQSGALQTSYAGLWYIYISLPLVSFIMYRWFWRFIVWCFFLYRVSCLKLQLQATHSDLCGGIGIMGVAQNLFGVVFLAMSMMTSAALANDLLYEGEQLADVKLFVIIYLIISVLVINAPLIFFSGKLFKLKRQALLEYSLLQAQSSEEFHQQWIIDKNKKMVDSMQPSALADYGAVYEVVNSIRLMPFNPRGVAVMVVVILTPFVPLVFTHSSVKDVILRIGDSVL